MLHRMRDLWNMSCYHFPLENPFKLRLHHLFEDGTSIVIPNGWPHKSSSSLGFPTNRIMQIKIIKLVSRKGTFPSIHVWCIYTIIAKRYSISPSQWLIKLMNGMLSICALKSTRLPILQFLASFGFCYGRIHSSHFCIVLGPKRIIVCPPAHQKSIWDQESIDIGISQHMHSHSQN